MRIFMPSAWMQRSHPDEILAMLPKKRGGPLVALMLSVCFLSFHFE